MCSRLLYSPTIASPAPCPNCLGDRAGLLWPILSVSILRVPGYVRLFRVVGCQLEDRIQNVHGRLSSGSFYGSRFGPMLGTTWARVLGAKRFQGTKFWPLGKGCPGIVLRCLLNLLFCQLKAFLSRAPQQEGKGPLSHFTALKVTLSFLPCTPLSAQIPRTPLLWLGPYLPRSHPVSSY